MFFAKEVTKRARQDSNPQPSDSKAGSAKSQLLENTTLTKENKQDLVLYLAELIRKYPELATLIEAWPKLSYKKKEAICTIISSFLM